MRRTGFVLLLYCGMAGAQHSGNALQFDGDNDFVLIPHQPELSFGAASTATFELWLKPTSAPNIWHAFGKRSGCGVAAGINYQLARDETSGMAFGTSTCGVATHMDLPLDKWSHLAITADGSTFRFYINGELMAQNACSFNNENTAPFEIGNSDGCPDTFPGLIDEVKVWNTAKSEFEIEQSWGCMVDTPPADLVGYWKFDEDQNSQVIVDSSLSGFNGNLGADANPADDDPIRLNSTAPEICPVFKDGFENTD